MRFLLVLISIVAGAILAPIALAAPPSTTASGEAATLDTATPKGALKSLAVAMDAGDAPAIRALLLTSTPSEEKMAATMADVAASISALNRAVLTRFGHDQAVAALGGDPSEMLKQSLSTIDAASERLEGDSATVSTPASESMMLRKQNGAWRILVSDLSKGSTPAAVDERVAMLSTQMKAMRDVTAGVVAGKYTSAADAVAAVRTRLGGPAQTAPSTEPVK